MKRLMALVVLLFVALSSARAQEGAPKGFSYQALIYDGSKPLRSTQVKLEIVLQSETAILYTERHDNLKTSAVGLVDVLVGTGSDVKGSLDAVDWEAGIFITLKVERDGSYEPLGQPVRVPTVPYALYASQQANSAQGDGKELNKPIFQVLNSQGKDVFSVYEHGIRISVADEPTRGVRGGFAVATYSKGYPQPFEALSLHEGRMEMMLMEGVERGVRGGFAVATRSEGAGAFVDRLFIGSTTDILVDDPPRGVRGGFAVSRRGSTLPTMEIANGGMQLNVDPAFRGVRGGFAVAHYAERDGRADAQARELMHLDDQMSYFTLARSATTNSSFTLRDRRDASKVVVSFGSAGNIYTGKGDPGSTIARLPNEQSKLEATWKLTVMNRGVRWNYPLVKYDGEYAQYTLKLLEGTDPIYEVRRLYNPEIEAYVEGVVLKEGADLTNPGIKPLHGAITLVDNPTLSRQIQGGNVVVTDNLLREVGSRTYYVDHAPNAPGLAKVYVELDYYGYGSTRTSPMANLLVSAEVIDPRVKGKIRVARDPSGLLFTMPNEDFTNLSASGLLDNVRVKLVSECFENGEQEIEVDLHM